MAVRTEILNLCRQEVDPSWKKVIRLTLRRFFKWKFKLYMLGEGCHLGSNSNVKNAWLGNFSSFGPRCEFNGPVVIGDLTMLSSDIFVIGQDHIFTNVHRPMRISFPLIQRPPTVIEADCWIGARVTIMEGVRIGRGSIIGAASTVTRSIPPYSIAVGSPARVIRRRFDSETAREHDRYLYGEAKYFSDLP